MIRKFCAVVIAGLTLLAFDVPNGYADSYQDKSCTASTGGVTYTGSNEVDYFSYSSTLWELDFALYKFGPSNTQSVHNNDNLYFWGGTNSWSWNSPDNLIRDNTWRTLTDLYSHGIFGKKAQSYMRFQDIFDVPNVSDPSCYATTATF